MKIVVTGEHEGQTREVCRWEFEPMPVEHSKDVTDEIFAAIREHIEHYVRSLNK